ncbi:MAG: TonB, C-terminal [Rhodocyclaceae bacterium]|nr:TonB, C-terminal [Rhodocyclaceae bacterium]
MTRTHRRLTLALAFSLLLHILPLLPAFAPAALPPRLPPLEARLLPPPPAEQPPLMLPEPPKSARAEPPRPARKPAAPTPPKRPAQENWTAEVKKQLKELDKRGLFYPEEAVAQGLEGEAVVLLILDESGNPVAARIEQSSGYKILDDAALRAVRSLRSLPAAAPRETQLPVRFRLR